MFEVGVFLTFGFGGFALLMFWLGTRPEGAEAARAGGIHYVHCANCFAEVRATRLTCPGCGSDEFDAE